MKYALRQLAANPGFTLVALVTLALGIGVNTTAFTVLNRLLLQPLPYQDPRHLVQVWSTSPRWQYMPHSPGDYYDEKEGNTVFEGMGVYCPHGDTSFADLGKPPTLVSGMAVDADFCPVMGISASLGRTFTHFDQTDESDSHTQYIMLSNSFWRRHFGSDPGVIGRTVKLTGFQVTIVGVVSPAYDDVGLFGQHVDIWSLEAPNVSRNEHEHAWYNVAARLKPGVTVEQAQAQMTTIAARLARDYPKTKSQRGLNVVQYPTDSMGEFGRNMTWMIMGLTSAVLLIACANLANLQLVRTTARAREFAIRVALGAPRGEMTRMLLKECLVLSLAGGALGLMVAKWANSYVAAFLDRDMPLDLRVLGFTFGISALTGAVFGTFPAWLASRTDANGALKQGGRGSSTDRSRHRIRHSLIVGELALALILLSGAGYFTQGIRQISHRQLGWRPENVLMGNVWLPDRYGGEASDKNRAFGTRFRSDLSALPGVDQVAIGRTSPAWAFRTAAFEVQGRPPPLQGQEPLAYRDDVSPGYLKTYGIQLLQGRDFADSDRYGAPEVAIVNSAMAENYWPGESPLGKRIRETNSSNPSWIEIVGVTNNIAAGSDLYPALTRFAFYLPYDQHASGPVFALHSANDPRVLEDRVRRVLANIEPDVTVSYMATAEETMASNLSSFMMVRRMLSVIAGLGLLLAVVGIYGVIANLVSERTQEVGIRMALGAQPGAVCWLFLRNGVRLALLGAGIGLLGSFGLMRILNAEVSIVPGDDPRVIVAVAALLVLVALLACWLPARRATKVNPMVALRAE